MFYYLHIIVDMYMSINSLLYLLSLIKEKFLAIYFVYHTILFSCTKIFYTEVVFAILSCIASFIYICPHDKSQIDINDRIMSLFALSTFHSLFLSLPPSFSLPLPPSLSPFLPSLSLPLLCARPLVLSLSSPTFSFYIYLFIYLSIYLSVNLILSIFVLRDPH